MAASMALQPYRCAMTATTLPAAKLSSLYMHANKLSFGLASNAQQLPNL